MRSRLVDFWDGDCVWFWWCAIAFIWDIWGWRSRLWELWGLRSGFGCVGEVR
ncbi:MAG: hypothetical protein HC903_32315 [Methylacidiphilales bacterium]|nr:hypothetical protein [Candidatus Methylacidiphilales bacterium]NJR19600.1 hypothetical protein [Calothrix sp. CSU_2_0]